MKRLLIILFIIISIKSYGQLPNQVGQGSELTEWWQKGITGADLGIRWRMSFADTTAANNYKGGILKNIAGLTIRTVDFFWSRSNDLTKWNIVNGSITAVTTVYRTPGIDSIYFIINGTPYAIKDSIGTGGGGGSDSVAVLNTVTQITSLSRVDVNQLVVTDTIRGGNFNRYTGSDGADGGMIFVDALGRKWMRQVDQTEPINVAWFGLVADGTTDNYAAFLTLKTYLVNHRINSDPGNPAYTYFARLRPIIFPAAFNYYKFSQTLNFEYPVTILGSEVGSEPWASKLLFPADSIGIALWWVDQYGAAGNSSNGNLLKNISIHAELDGTRDTTAHGIKVRAISRFENVNVENFGGNGFDINSTDPITSNVDFCVLTNVRAYYNWNGLFVKGGEANVISVYDGDFSINMKWGVYDVGFLGNFYYGCHASSNGTVTSGQKTYVIHRTGGIGIRYQYAAKYDGFLTMPGDSTGWENDWVLVGDSTIWHNGYAPDYVAGTYYWVGGSYYLETGRLVNCYDEAGSEMGRYVGLYAATEGGTHGAGFQWNSIGGFRDFYNGDMTLPRPGAGYTAGDIGFNYSKLRKEHLTFYRVGGQGIRYGFDTTAVLGEIVDLGTGTSRTKFTTLGATASSYGRSSFLEGILYNQSGVYIGSFDDLKATLVVYGTTVPASGTWSVGDLVIKKNVSLNDVYGWRCIIAGTPGTWETLTFIVTDSVTTKWSTLGNSPSGTTKLGTLNNNGFNFVTNDVARASISSSGLFSTVQDAQLNAILIGQGPTSGLSHLRIGDATTLRDVIAGSLLNMGIGISALKQTTTGDFNIGIGYTALEKNTTGSDQNAFGRQAGQNNVGDKTVFLGGAAGVNCLSCSYNINIENSNGIGNGNSTGDDNIIIANRIGGLSPSLHRSIIISDSTTIWLFKDSSGVTTINGGDFRYFANYAANYTARSFVDKNYVDSSVLAGGSGEVNTASNLGGGLANYDSKSGVDLRFNSFAAADFDLASNLITIDATKWLTISAATAAYQPLNANLTTYAGIAPSSDIQTFLGSANNAAARNNILPSKTSNALKVLRVNAGETDYELATISGGSPGGSNTEIQFNNSSAFGGSANFTWNGSRMSVIAATIGSTSTPDATSPLTIDAASTNTAYLLQMGKNGNPAYFRIDKDGNITDIGGGAAPIGSAGGKPLFSSGFASASWASNSDGNVILRTDGGGTLPWVLNASASTTNSMVSLRVMGNNAATKGDIQQWTDNSATVLSVVDKDGKIGVGVSSPTAYLHLKAGTATANTAPIKLNTGTALTTPEDGAIEYHGSHLYFTVGSTRYQLDQQSGGATAAQLRRFGSSDVTGTNANVTAAAGNVIYLPAATLSTNRTIDVSGLNTDGDYLEIYNSEAGFTWSFTGASVYLLDRTTTVTNLSVDAVYKIVRVSGKLIINN